MLRLLGLMAVTLLGFYIVLSIYGTGDPRAARRAELQTDAPRAAEDPGAPDRTAPAPQADPAPEPAAEVVQATSQTPEQVQRFPGPALRPSPEYPNGTPDADGTAPAPAAVGSGGPVMYVTGNSVNFRAGPSTGNAVIGALSRGAAVEALGPTDASWVNIRDTQGREGYMSGQFLSTDQPN